MLIFYLVINANDKQFERSIHDMESSLVSIQRNIIVSKVESIINLITYKQAMTESILQEKVKARVDVAFSIAENIYNENRKTHTTDQIQKLIIDSLRPLTWNNGESFIFILDFDGVFHLAPQYLRDKEGTSIIDFQDANKRFVIREEIALVKNKGQGFLWDTFTRPGYDKNKQFKQLAYVKDFGAFNWYMGSAEYLDTTEKEVAKSILKMIDHFASDRSDYFFVLDIFGNMIMDGQHGEIEGTNILTLKDENDKLFVKELLKKADIEKPDFVRYKWKNPRNGLIEEKYSYVKKVPNSDWIVGNGYYVNDLNKKIEVKKNELYLAYWAQLKIILWISIILIILAFFSAYKLSRLLKLRFMHYADQIKNKNDELTELNTSLENLVKVRTHQLQNAYKNMEELATTDTLTGINNRYAFNEALRKEIYRSDRHNVIFSLLMLDLDHFKDINDTYGHDIGDSVLIKMTELVKSCLRDEDIFARVGGEEFMIILPQTDIRSAFDIAVRIRHLIESFAFNLDQTITLSIGVSTYHKGEDAEEVTKRADIALYEAKNRGRNTVVMEDT